MTAVHGTCTAFALNVFVPIGGFDDITTELALNCISYDFSHRESPCFDDTQYTSE
jgi:hypothetical protein